MFRYRALAEDELAANDREEEDRKRQAAEGAAVGFDYNNPPQQQQQQQPQEPPSLRVLANCIEKTAEFITKQVRTVIKLLVLVKIGGSYLMVTQQPTESILTESGFLPIFPNSPKNNLDSPNF